MVTNDGEIVSIDDYKKDHRSVVVEIDRAIYDRWFNKQPSPGGDYVRLLQAALVEAANIKMPYYTSSVWHWMLANLDYGNKIVVVQADVARELDLDPARVNKAVKQLVDEGLVLKGSRVGKSWSYQLNPYVGFKGSQREHGEAMQRAAQEWGLADQLEPVEPGGGERDGTPDTDDDIAAQIASLKDELAEAAKRDNAKTKLLAKANEQIVDLMAQQVAASPGEGVDVSEALRNR